MDLGAIEIDVLNWFIHTLPGSMTYRNAFHTIAVASVSLLIAGSVRYPSLLLTAKPVPKKIFQAHRLLRPRMRFHLRTSKRGLPRLG